MSLGVKIQVDIKPVVRMLTDVQKKQVPFAAAQAINDVAFQAMRAERAGMSEVFKHPRPFTQRAPIVSQKAKKGSLSAIVSVNPAAERYLDPYEFGGRRALPGKGMALINPVDIKLDAYGQIRGKPSAIAGRTNVFVGDVRTKQGPVRGFWRRLKNHHLQLLIRFTRVTDAKKHLDFVKRGERVVQARFQVAFSTAMAKALAKR